MLKKSFAIVAATSAAVLWCTALSPVGATQAPASAALTGQVSSQEEGPMEGVLVSAKREGSTITITVVSDARGRFSFPRTKLEPGSHALRIRAVGYEVASPPGSVDITAQKPAQLDLTLRKAQDISSQLSNAEWFMSMPRPEYQKQGFVGFGPGGNTFADCITCHTVERIVRSPYTASEFQHEVLPRMGEWASGSTPQYPLKRIPPRPRPAAGARPELARFLSSINLSRTSRWEYPLKTLPRPKGKATRVIITEYDLPRRDASPHDVVVDAEGLVWYGDFGENVLGVLDPRAAKAVEYAVPEVKPGHNTGFNNIEVDRDGNLWIALFNQPGLARFDRKTRTFRTWSVPKELDRDGKRTTFLAAIDHYADGKVWLGAGMNPIHRIDLQSGQWETADLLKDLGENAPAPGRPHGIYDMVSDSKNNLYALDIQSEYIVKVDARTLKATYYQTPTLNSGPRRGHMDSQDRLWFAEHGANKVAMFDTKTGRFQEWEMPTPFSNPYDVIQDKNADVWIGGMTSDRITRLNPQTGEFIEYLLPRATNVRRVYVDNSTNPVNFWVGNNNDATIVKVEPLE